MTIRGFPITTMPTSRVLFHDKPSQVINLSDLLGAIFALIVLGSAYVLCRDAGR